MSSPPLIDEAGPLPEFSVEDLTTPPTLKCTEESIPCTPAMKRKCPEPIRIPSLPPPPQRMLSGMYDLEVRKALCAERREHAGSVSDRREALDAFGAIWPTPQAVVGFDSMMFTRFQVWPTTGLIAQLKGRFKSIRIKQMAKCPNISWAEIDQKTKTEWDELDKIFRAGSMILGMWKMGQLCDFIDDSGVKFAE